MANFFLETEFQVPGFSTNFPDFSKLILVYFQVFLSACSTITEGW